MSQIVLHLMKHKIDGERGLRYLNVRLSNDEDTITPLFFGTDLLNNSGMNPSNHCRIHTRYAKIGLATKIIFPPDVTISGLNHCLNGAWFYSLQGVFQVIFEHQNRRLQLKIVTSLIDTWRSLEADPKLPRRLSVSLQSLQLNCQPSEEISIVAGEPLCEKKRESDNSIVVDSTSDYESNYCTAEMSEVQRQPSPEPVNFQHFVCELLQRVENFSTSNCTTENNCQIKALISFMKLISCHSQISQIFSSFLEIISAYNDVVNMDCKLITTSDFTWNVDKNDDALLNLVGAWLGKNLHEFQDIIAKKVDVFKVENFCLIDELPSANILVPRLFPDCMRLLIGYWIGLYGSPPSPPLSQDTPIIKKPSDRQDHSYSTNTQTVKLACGKREDHSYSTANPTIITTTTTWLETLPVALTPTTRDDHTYVHHENAEDHIEQPKTRRDHTYVSTKEPKAAKHTISSVNVSNNHLTSPLVTHNTKTDPGGMPATKKSKLDPNGNKSDCPYVVDPTKHSFVLLILEFLNNVLVSGIGHVVYSRLVQTN